MRYGHADDNFSADVAAEKRAQVDRVVGEFIRLRRRGEGVSEERLAAAYPELQPELGHALRTVRSILAAAEDARAAGPVAEPIQPLTLSKLDEPIVVSVEEKPDASDDASGNDFFPDHVGPAVDPKLSIEGFEILSEAGDPGGGGQARVFKARRTSTGRIVAIKVLHGGPYLNSRARSRYEREVRILGELNHPNIVGVIDRARTADGSFFIVMDFVDGRRLDEYLHERRTELTQRDVLALLLKIVDAVAEAHRKRVVHRDLKPSNVRVDARGEPHVLDFGLARLLTEGHDGQDASATAGGYLVGTLSWASPEQAEGDNDRVREPSDVYSLGVMFYRLLTGCSPYPQDLPPRRLAEAIRDRAPAPPSSVSDAPFGPIDGKLEAILLKALSKRPLDRYASAGALAEDIRRYLSHQPVLAPSRAERRRRLLLATTASMILLSLATWGLMHRFGGPPRPTVIELKTTQNSVGMKMIEIPTGHFYTGASATATVPGGGSAGGRLVRIGHHFEISATEVTRREYALVMGKPAPPASEADLPQTEVSWDEAVRFCELLSAGENVTYRLPVAAEWEYVCRAGRSTDYGGNGDLDSTGWYAGNAGRHLHPVGRKFPNHWGVYDMHGNAEEWCWDAVGPLPQSLVGRVQDGGAGDVRSRVRRGGSILSPKERCTASWSSASPRDSGARARGFRVVRGSMPTPTPQPSPLRSE